MCVRVNAEDSKHEKMIIVCWFVSSIVDKNCEVNNIKLVKEDKRVDT